MSPENYKKNTPTQFDDMYLHMPIKPGQDLKSWKYLVFQMTTCKLQILKMARKPQPTDQMGSS